MASIHRRGGSKYWYASFRLPKNGDGHARQIMRCTKQTSKSEALRAAFTMEEAALREAGAGTEQSAKVYALLQKAADLAARGHLTVPRGRDLLKEMLDLSAGREVELFTTRRWLEMWLGEKSHSSAPGTILRYKTVVESFLRSIGDRADQSIELLAPEDFQEFRNEQKREGKSPATVNAAIKIIRIALNAARRRAILRSNPAEAVELVAQPKTTRDVLSPQDVARLVAVAEGDWRGLILAGYYTGARLGDLTRLTWKDIDPEVSVIRFRQQKTGAELAVPIHSEFAVWLRERPRPSEPSAPVFPSLHGRSSAGNSGLSSQFARILRKAGILPPAPAATSGHKGRNRSQFSFHSLRHSFNSAMANAGVPQEVRQLLTGHASKAINDAYTHTEIGTLRRAVETLPPLQS